MRHNSRQPSQVAGDNSAGRTRNRTRENLAQNSNVLDMTGRPQTERIGPSTGTNPSAPVLAPGSPPALVTGLMRRAMMVPSTSVSSTASSASFAVNLLSEENSPRGDGREGVEANAADNTILGAPPAKRPRLA